MGDLCKQKPLKLVCSLFFKDEDFLEYAEKKIKSIYGPLEDTVFNGTFGYTDYYRTEFGVGLKRKLVCFSKLVKPENIARVKLATNRIEKKTLMSGKRRVNIDPGYLTEAKLVLLTTKDYSHRVYLGQGIFAETTLYFKEGSFRSWPWTYPDYASDAFIGYFNKVRALYIRDLQGGAKHTCV